MKRKILLILFLIIIICSNLTSEEHQRPNILFLHGSNIYVRIFLFYFPLANKYKTFFNLQETSFNLEILLKENNIKKEPLTPSYFDSDLIFLIKDIPYNKSGKYKLPITIRCNKKFIFKKVKFLIYRKQNILILKGSIDNLYLKEITENEYFKNRFNWKFPFYFDIRLQINSVNSE